MTDLSKETKLIKMGFKKVWFSDKSGYWFEQEFFCALGNVTISVDLTDKNGLSAELKSFYGMNIAGGGFGLFEKPFTFPGLNALISALKVI